MVRIVWANAGYKVQCETRDGGSEWPIRYKDGEIAYDHPYQINKGEKRQVEQTFAALNGDRRWAIWEWIIGNEGSTWEQKQVFCLAKLTNEKWPAHEAFEQVAERKGYDRLVTDSSLIGGYFVSPNGDCLICLPSGMKPWVYAEG